MEVVDVFKGDFFRKFSKFYGNFRFITARGDLMHVRDMTASPESKLKYIADLSFESHRLKTERNPSK